MLIRATAQVVVSAFLIGAYGFASRLVDVLQESQHTRSHSSSGTECIFDRHMPLATL
jgi:hypothetical protein